MKKALCFGPRDLRIVDVPERAPGPGEVKARMLLTTLSTANLRLYQGPLVAGLRYPVTLSYTGVAEVVAVGQGVENLAPGDRVYPNWYRACGRCAMCRADRMVACVNVPEGAHNMTIGEQYESGLQEEIVLPAERLWPVPRLVPIESAALIGALAVSMQAETALAPEAGDTLLVAGAGPIGWGVIQLGKLRGCRVVAADVKPERLRRAEEYGAEAAAAPTKQAVLEACGQPPLFVVDASGTEAGSQLAFDVAARGARVAVIGVTNRALSQHSLILKGLSVFGIGGGIKQARVIELMAAGKLDLSGCMSQRYPFSRLREAFELMRTDREVVRVAIDLAA